MKRTIMLLAAIAAITTVGCNKGPGYDPPGKPPKEKTWTVTTIAGDGTADFADGAALSAKFHSPADIVVAPDGTLYITDVQNRRIRKISGGQVSTFAGNDTSGLRNGTGAEAEFLFPYFITADANGNLFTSDLADSRIRKITPGAVVTTYAGSTIFSFQDGAVASSLFTTSSGLVTDAQGNVFVADTYNQRVREITTGGQVRTIAGQTNAGLLNGTGTAAKFREPAGITIDKQGNLYVAEPYNFCVRKVTPQGVVTTYAGSGVFDFADGRADTARFRFPQDVTIDKDGNLFVTDDNRIRMITPQGIVSTIAGGSTAGFKDGDGKTALFNAPTGLGIDAQGNIYVADLANHRIRKISFQ